MEIFISRDCQFVFNLLFTFLLILLQITFINLHTHSNERIMRHGAYFDHSVVYSDIKLKGNRINIGEKNKNKKKSYGDMIVRRIMMEKLKFKNVIINIKVNNVNKIFLNDMKKNNNELPHEYK